MAEYLERKDESEGSGGGAAGGAAGGGGKPAAAGTPVKPVAAAAAGASVAPGAIGFEAAENSIDQVLIKATPVTRQGSGTGVADPREIDKVIYEIARMKGWGMDLELYNRILASAALLCQQGATSPKFADSRVAPEYDVYLKVSEFRAALKVTGITARKFARGIRGIIIKVARLHGLEGNLSKSYKLEVPNADAQDLIWVSDFQTFSDDPAMPEGVRQWLLENYRTRFRPSAKSVQKQTGENVPE